MNSAHETDGDGRHRRQPATIRPRTDPDPVDVALSDVTDTDSRQPARHPHGDTTGPADSRQRQGDGDSPDRQPTADNDRATATARTDSRQPTTTAGGDTGNRYRHDDKSAAADAPPATPTPQPPTATPPTSPGVEPGQGESMKSASFTLPPSLIERVRSAQWYTQVFPDGHHNVSELVRTVLWAEVQRLEAAHNAGEPFPRVERLRSGPSPQGAVRGAQLRARRRRLDQSEWQPQAGAGEGAQDVPGEALREGGPERTNPASEGGAAGGG